MRGSVNRLSVILADDHTIVARGIRSILEGQFDVVGIAADGRTLVKLAEHLKPDIILLDISMPQLNGIEAARQLSKSLPKSKLIFVTMHADPDFVTEALKAGASGYVIKRSAPEELVTAIDQVWRGRTYITPLVTKDFVDSALSRQNSEGPVSRLTARQREVLQLVAEGRTVKQIAGALHVTPKTVEFHKSGIMRALNLYTTADLVKYAIRHGIVSVEES